MRVEVLTQGGPVTGNCMPKEGAGPESDPVRGEAWTKPTDGMGDDAAPSPAPTIERSRSMFLKVRPASLILPRVYTPYPRPVK